MIIAALPRKPPMRRLLPILCLLALLLSSCATVHVEQQPVTHGPPPGEPGAQRADRANTDAFPPGQDGYRPPARLAVLLPMSGTLASAGQSVRDGFLAAYYAEPRTRPVLKFYDSAGTGAGAQAAMAKAIADDAQMIVGPLTREEVNAVAGSAGALPTIMLNRGSQPSPRGSASFALLPEDEGAFAADRLADRGIRHVLVIASRADSAQRSVVAFRNQLQQRGGSVVGEVPVAGEIPDLSTQFSGFMAAATPPQAVFLALDAAPARTIAAQLKASSLAALPKVSTAQILNGAGGKGDAELDGIEYPDLPWMLGQGGGLPDAAALAKSLPGARGGGQRLFAFGADAWRLVAYFERLYNDPGFSVAGATGELQIAVRGGVTRTPAWAVFSGGHSRPAPTVAPAPRDGGAGH
jgi:outer membrane PBP1 activator LpoA protein